MQISCPKCQRIIPTDALNMQQLMAKCTACHHLFSFQDRLPPWPESSEDAFLAPRPKNLTVTQDGLSLVLRWRWFRLYVFLLIPFAIFWNAIVFTFVSALTPWPYYFSGDIVDVLVALTCSVPLLAIPHLWVGLWLIYYILCLFFNQTIIVVRKTTITVRHAPLPWLGNKTVETSLIAQLYTKEQRSGQRNRDSTFEVHLIDRNNQHAKLVTGLPSSEHALYVEQEIERFLGIIDRPVRGEYR